MLKRTKNHALLALLIIPLLSGCVKGSATAVVTPEATVSSIGMRVVLEKDDLATLYASDKTGPRDITDLEKFKQDFLNRCPYGPRDTTPNGVNERAQLESECTFTETSTEYIAECTLPADSITFPLVMDKSFIGLTLEKNNDLNLIIANLPGVVLKQQYPVDDYRYVGMELRLQFPGAVRTVTGKGAVISQDDPRLVIIDEYKTDGHPVTIAADATPIDPPVPTVPAYQPPTDTLLAFQLALLGFSYLLIVLAFIIWLRRRR